MTTSPRRRRLIFPILLTVVVVLIAATVVSWRWSTRPQGEAQAVEFATAELSAPLLDARVLALGEATHGNAEYQDLRLELSRKVVPNGTRTIILEEDYGQTLLVNDWIQGGEGTAEEAALRFGFRINQTVENARWLSWLREFNEGQPAGEKVQLLGMDVQRTEANKALALDGLAEQDPATAERLRAALAEPESMITATSELFDATLALPEDHPNTWATRTAAQALRHNVELISTEGYYGDIREAAMFDMLVRLVEHSPTPVLLFGHNAHVAKAEQGMLSSPVGARAAEKWGDGYRVIGTDFIRTEFLSGNGTDRQAWTLQIRSPLQGMFEGTQIGYLDFTDTTGTNRELVDSEVTMGSAGENFNRFQQLLPFGHLVAGVPSTWYDSLIVVADATPTTML
ncbi:MAG: erythromycin esterase family protein [Corynebacterium sp.]|uniref:erythromycin esterase family protein n=1 Tax=Corynebacterium sp. TaxID=1720 RepID=UPI0026DF541F|nr:erythromycin esterase family protein [Corynebacterium sp.]MDO5669794.1 erythromycin esterase family protein [Corynebacterium sp.]